MATYKEIQNYVKNTYGFSVSTCFIVDAKEKCSLPVRKAWNRIDPKKRKHPCPDRYLEPIKKTFEFYGMIKKGGD